MNNYPHLDIEVPKGFVWYYRQLIRGGDLSHCWVLNGPKGAIHVDAFLGNFEGVSWIGGIECHTPCAENEASHKHCWILGGPCKHEGSSLQFSEQIAPELPEPWELKPHEFTPRVHGYILSIMQNRYQSWIEEAS